MKKILFKNASTFIMCALLLPFVITSCQKNAPDVLPDNTNDVTSSANAWRTGLSPVALILTVDNTTGYKITSDGRGNYENGLQNVSASFDQYGNFIFNCGTTSPNPSSPLARWLNFNFNDPIVVYTTPPITTGNNVANAMTSLPGAAFSPYTALQNLAVKQTECITLTGGPTYKNAPAWTANFHRGAAEDVSSSPTAYAVVTRISSTQWIMTPVGGCSPNSNVAALRNGPGTLYGYYNIPFFFTLTAK